MNFMYYILIAVIVLVVAIDLYQKKKNEKSDSTDVDKFNDNSFSKEPKKFNPLLLIGGSLIFFTIAFFVTDKFVYDGRLSDNSDGITLIQNLTYEKFNISELEADYQAFNEDGPQTTYTFDNKKITGILVDKFGNYEGVVINGFPQSMHRRFFENGQLMNESEYKNGMRNGLFKIWYENGNTKQESILKNGFKDGPCKTWYANGQIKEDYTSERMDGFSAMYNVGSYKEWYENGQIKIEGYKRLSKRYKYSEWDGSYKEWFDNGNLKKKHYYKDGNLDDLQQTYHSNGNLSRTEYFRNGKSFDKVRWFDTDGLKEQEVLYNDKGIGYVIRLFRENGTLSIEKFLEDGYNWLDDEGNFNENYKYLFFYDDDGKRFAKDLYKNGVKYGATIFF